MMAKPPETSRSLRHTRREEHDALPSFSDDETKLTPVDVTAIIGDLDIRPIEPPARSTSNGSVSAGARRAKETTAVPDDAAAADGAAPPAAGVTQEAASAALPTQPDEPPGAVFGADSRTLCTPTNVFPNRAVCKLVVTYPTTPAGKAWAGTGSMIGGRHVLTAGHVLFKAAEGGWAKTITVIPGLDAKTAWFGSEMLTWPNFKQRSVTGWTVDGDSDYDYGLITLNTGFSVGSFGLLYLSDDDLDSTTAYLIGYPGDVPNNADKGLRQFAVAAGAALTDYDSDLVYYAMDTFNGQSGAGVYRFWNGVRAIFAVHGGQYDSDENCGARITKARHDQIRGWQKQD
jgi:V8-like Glu-specific endopeptidase